MKDKIRVLALLDTLEYLRRSGRISSLVAFVREILSNKPVIAIVEGKVSYLEEQEEQKMVRIYLTNSSMKVAVSISLYLMGLSIQD